MKIAKLEKLVSQHSWLANYLAQKRHLYAYKRGNQKQIEEFRDYVRTNIKYVAFRPWESLNLSEGATKKSKPLGNYGHMLHEVVEYDILWHSDKSVPFTQNTDCHAPFRSLAKTIAGVIYHLTHYPGEETTRTIHLDAVVRHSYTYSTVLGDYTNEQWEIFLCPEGWTPS